MAKLTQQTRKKSPKKPAKKPRRTMSNDELRALEPQPAQIEIITPELATEYLKNNPTNRKLKPMKIAQYARAMKSGNWDLNGSTISQDYNGNWLDGQNRFHACIEAGVPFITYVARGLDPSVRKTIDSGAGRTFADDLVMQNTANANTVAAIVQWCMRYEDGAMATAKGYTSRFEQLDWLHANDGVLAVADYAVSLKVPARKGVTRTMFGGLIYEAKGLEAEAMEFIDAFLSKVGLTKGHPALALLNFVERNDRPHKRPSSLIYSAVIIKAFNAFVKGEDAVALRYGSGFGRTAKRKSYYTKEPFPVILTAADLKKTKRKR